MPVDIWTDLASATGASEWKCRAGGPEEDATDGEVIRQGGRPLIHPGDPRDIRREGRPRGDILDLAPDHTIVFVVPVIDLVLHDRRSLTPFDNDQLAD